MRNRASCCSARSLARSMAIGEQSTAVTSKRRLSQHDRVGAGAAADLEHRLGTEAVFIEYADQLGVGLAGVPRGRARAIDRVPIGDGPVVGCQCGNHVFFGKERDL